MTDEEKIKWFDATVKWMEQWGSPGEARDHGDFCQDGPNDLFFDFCDQYEKVKNNE